LLVSHIRYQGFQGNIRATTRPVSFDASALPAILALPEFTTWRAANGLIVSDSLGSDAVRDFYSQQGADSFSPRVVAREAFLAGNDLLYLGNIKGDSTESDTYTVTLEILDYFTQEYNNDPVFAQRVDAAVLRILARKLDIYQAFNLNVVRTPDINLAQIGVSQQVMFDVARESATLISPDPQELSTLLPSPPGRSDSIVFITDPSTQQQCSTCPAEAALAVDALQNDIVRLYGQSGSAQIQANRLQSFSLAELNLMLDSESTTDIEAVISRAAWVVISLVDVNNGQLTTLRRFFAERPNLVRNKNVILFSFTAPYYLDATDISKLNAYYALYSKQPAFVDVAARLLFQQVALQGASPVSIPAVGYDLITVTAPDPQQVIPLSLDQDDLATPTVDSSTPESILTPAYRIGDSIAVRAGPILDRNGHIVPDGTVARFTMSTRDDTGGILRFVDAITTGGIARANFVIDKPGNVEINVTSEPALISVTLQFAASSEGVIVTEVAPLITATATEVLPTPTPIPTPIWVTLEGYPRMGGWFLALLGLLGSVGLAFWAVSKIDSILWGVRWALCMSIGGLIGYNYLALGLPGAAEWIAAGAGVNGMLLLMFSGETLGGIAALIWMRRASASTSQAD
jgi:beta-N-acetylhexosaminidase